MGKKEIISKKDFYRSKYEYYARYCQLVVIMAAICSVFYFYSDCQLFGGLNFSTFIPRFIIIIPLLFYIWLLRRNVSYKIIIVVSYLILHLIMWNTIWAIVYLPDKTHASEGFIIMHLMFLAIGFFSPAKFSAIMHALVIVNILVSNQFNHYKNLDLMMSLGVPCTVAVIAVYFVMENLYVEHYKTNLRLQESSLYDSLTSVHNRNIIPSLIEEDNIHFKKAFGQKVAVMIFDIDFFKRVNDEYGHGCGDKILSWICATVKEMIDDNYIIRWGGEEFLLIFPGMDLKLATMKAEQIRSKIEMGHNSICPVTVSIGVDIYDLDDIKKSNYKVVIDNADRALYFAKRTGRNRVEVFDAQRIDQMYLIGRGGYTKQDSELDKSGLENRIFDAFAATSKTQYIYLCNMKTNVSRWSRYAVDYFGLPDEYIFNTGEVWLEYVHPDDRERYMNDINAVFSGEKNIHDVDYRARNKEGKYVLCSCKGVVLKGENGEPDYFAGTMANHGIIDMVDPVTTLYNTYELLNTIRQRFQNRKPFALLMTGLMHYSDINDTHGYSNSDRILQTFATQIKDQFGDEVILFREDGVKFALLFNKQMEHSEIEKYYAKIQEIAFQKIYLDDVHIPLSVAGGCISVDQFSGSEYTVRAGATYALQISKREGYGKLIHFDRSQEHENRSDLAMMNNIVASVSNYCEGFYMMYHPIINNNTEQIAGVEALLRWKDKSGATIPPYRYISWLETEPCFYQLGNWIMERSMTEIAPIIELHPDFVLNINIAYSQIQHPSFREDFLDILKRTNIPRKNICLELTERCTKMNLKVLKELLKFIKELGVKVALDDFGTGFSSYELLRELPIDELKIDQSFIRRVKESEKDKNLVQSIIDCAEALKIVSCIEGVETKELDEYLKPFGATYHQGFYFARPMTIDSLAEYVK